MKKANPIWTKNESNLTGNQSILDFLAGEDVLLDRELFGFDIQATIAHVNGLQRIDILDETETQEIVTCLNELNTEFKAGNFILDIRWKNSYRTQSQ